MWFSDRQIPFVLLSTVAWGLSSFPIRAQLLPDNSLAGESSIVTPNITIEDRSIDLIKGGAVRENNLFHSFTEFNVPPDRDVYFSSPNDIDNILTRVTGNNISQIFGTLGVNGTANLFLLNPNGIVFGENAALDINGSFLATTADSYIFDNGFAYGATNPEIPPLLTINIPVGLQFNPQPQAIEILGKGHEIELPELGEPFEIEPNSFRGLEVLPRNTLGLIGGAITLEGGNLKAPGGRVELGSIAQSSQIPLIPTVDGFTFDYGAIKSKTIHCGN